MGSFNQVCLLTRAPIKAGDDVVVWEEIKGPWFNSESSGLRHGLLFGLPQRAQYDDYGGAEEYVDQKLFALHEQAWKNQMLYRVHEVKSSYHTSILNISCNPETMSKTHELAPLFYGLEELNPYDVFENGYEDVFQDKKRRAEVRAKTVLMNIGERIGKAELPTDKSACLAALFHIVQQEVGEHLAWPVWHMISIGELFAKRELCMMRAEAYDFLVKTVGNSIVFRYQARNSKKTFRDSLANKWLDWEEKRKTIKSKNLRPAGLDLREHRLMPVGLPWGVEEKPIESFFWNGLSYDTLIEAIGKEPFLDALVFATASLYIRSPLKAEEGGGQTEDWKLHADMMKAVHRKAREEGPLKRDWYPYL